MILFQGTRGDDMDQKNTVTLTAARPAAGTATGTATGTGTSTVVGRATGTAAVAAAAAKIAFPVIDPEATGRNIRRMRTEKHISNQQMMRYFGFNNTQTIYKWQRGETLPTVENLLALSRLLGEPMERILVVKEDTAEASGGQGQVRDPAEEAVTVYLNRNRIIYLVPLKAAPV